MNLIRKLELGAGPKLTAVSDWSVEYHAELEDYLRRLRKLHYSNRVCRERVLLCVPDEKPFRHLMRPEDILRSLETSHKNCLFTQPYKSSWRTEHIYQYSCCERCRLVLDAVISLANRCLSTSPKITVERKKQDSLSLGSFESPLLSVSVVWVDGDEKTQKRFYDMLVRDDEEWSIQHSSHALTKERLDVSIRWFKECSRKHCCRPNNVSFVPRRLIYVGNGSLPPRLVETGSSLQDSGIKYAALSYCWGTGRGTFTTTFDNLESSKCYIPLGQLPKTIQDAIHICRGLELSYLWVDAVCIIQDPGHEDWYEQSAQMRQIYSNAQVTIAADDAPECTVGFWHPDKTEFRRINGGCWIRDTPGRAHDILSTRGWTLQERILSHRILHFSSIGISWECDERCRGEDGQDTLDFFGLSYRAFRLLNRSSHHERLGNCLEYGDYVSQHKPTHITDFLTSGSWKSIYFAWASIMENYSERNLTQPKDKLSAISGLASFVVDTKNLGPESYLAGLWAEDLVEGLLWYVSSIRASRSRSTYIAPTWSWASVTGSIRYFRERYQFIFQPRITVRHAHCTASPSDPTGRVNAGVICLEGTLAQVDVAVDLNSSSTTYIDCAGSPIRVQGQPPAFVCGYKEIENSRRKKPRWYEVIFDEEPESSLPFLARAKGERDGAPINAPRDALDPQRMYFCLSVGELVDSFTYGKRHWFLVLQKIPEVEETYSRVGIGYFQHCKRVFPLFDYDDVRTISLI